MVILYRYLVYYSTLCNDYQIAYIILTYHSMLRIKSWGGIHLVGYFDVT